MVLSTKIKKIVDSCTILSIFNIKKIRGLPKTVDTCAILVFLIFQKIKTPKNISQKIKIEQ